MNMIKFRVIFLGLLILFCVPLYGQIWWEMYYGGDNWDTGLSIDLTSDGGYIVAGNTASYGAGQGDVYLVKLNAYGDTLWTRTYGGPRNESGYSVQQTSDNGYIIAGITNSFGANTNTYDYYLIKTDSEGDTLWTKTYGGVYDDYGFSVQQTMDGGYVLAGWRMFGGMDTAAYLVKTDANGDTIWSRMYSGTGQGPNFICYSAQQTSDSGYILAGYNYPHPLIRSNVYLVKTDADGDTVWQRGYGPANNEDYGFSVRQTSDGGYVVVGSTSSNPSVNTDVYLVKTNADGDSLWAKAYNCCNRWDYGKSVEQTPDGGYIIAGNAWPSVTATDYDVYLVKTNAGGDSLWARIYGGAQQDVGWEVKPASDGGYIVAGWTQSYGNGPRDVYVIKTKANGGVVNEQNYDGHRLNPVFSIKPNPFTDYAFVPGHESERFILCDISGRQMGVYQGGRIGEDLPAGVYFLRLDGNDAESAKIVKLR